MHGVRRLLRLLGIASLVPVLFLLGCQSRLIYYPRPYGKLHLVASQKAGVQALGYHTSQGKQVAHYLPPRLSGTRKPNRIWVCFAGNGSLALDWVFMRSVWADEDACLLVDYPGYGLCEGKPNPARIRASARAAVEALARHQGTSVEEMTPRLAVLGHSIGCAAGLMLAHDLGVQRIVLISPFTSMTDMGRRVLGWPLCYLNLHRFDNRHHLAAVVQNGAKVTVLHGKEDDMIPVEMSRELAAAHPQAVRLLEIPEAGHNDILDFADAQIREALQ